jgi:exopolysaccharide biosynthesis polyprenyl glycosylphosphotransferase
VSLISTREIVFQHPQLSAFAVSWPPTPYAMPQYGWYSDASIPSINWHAAAKRSIDIIVALLVLVSLSPLLLLVAIAIKLDSDGPVLFRQRRIGLHGHAFEVLKFRTMHHQAAEYGLLRQTCRNDPRVTCVGALLRRTSVDELPQLWHVLRGDMSLVGPRPHAPGTCAGNTPFEQISALYGQRHLVRPGMTGLAQVRGWRGQTDTEEKLLRRLDSDLEYIATWSLWLDFVILARTVAAVLRMNNAY